MFLKRHLVAIDVTQIKLEGYEWSYPFAVEKETSIVVPVHKANGERRFIKVDVRGYEEGSRFSIMFRLGSTRGPYRFAQRLHTLCFWNSVSSMNSIN